MQDYKIIKLINGGETLVDESDYEWASKFRWFRSTCGYAYRQGWNGPSKNGDHWVIWLHRQINDTPPHKITDHINRIRLDNRRSNLRSANGRQNSANQGKGKGVNISSPLKGVSYHPSTRLWRARAGDGSETTYHKTEQQAALDYNRMATELFGEFAALNVLPEGIKPTVRKPKSSQYRGVHWHNGKKRWRAVIDPAGKGIHLGSFRNEIDAAIRYNEAAKLHFGDRAKLNPV